MPSMITLIICVIIGADWLLEIMKPSCLYPGGESMDSVITTSLLLFSNWDLLGTPHY